MVLFCAGVVRLLARAKMVTRRKGIRMVMAFLAFTGGLFIWSVGAGRWGKITKKLPEHDRKRWKYYS